MSGLNKMLIIGRMTADPELRVIENGNEVVNFTLAVSEKFKDKSGNQQETCEFINVQFWGKPASVINQYCKKGSQLYVEGKFKTDKQEKDGVTRYFTKITGFQFQFLDSKPQGQQNQQGGYQQPQNNGGQNFNQGGNQQQDSHNGFEESQIPF